MKNAPNLELCVKEYLPRPDKGVMMFCVCEYEGTGCGAVLTDVNNASFE